MKKKSIVVGIGLIALDVVSGGSEHVNREGRYAGGTCGNVMTLLAFFGWDAQPVGRVAADVAGKLVFADMKRFGVGLEYLALAPMAPTPVVMQRIINVNGQPRHVFTWACSECGARFPGYQPVTLGSIDEALKTLPIPSVLFCDRGSPGAVRLANHCRERGSIIVFEAAGIGSPAHFRRMLELAHVLKYSHETKKVVDLLHSHNPGTALLEIETLGASGLRYRMRTKNDLRWHERSAFRPARLSDTAGSGDWLTAGLIDRLCKDGVQGLRAMGAGSIIKALDYAQSLSAWNCAFEGARGGMYGVTPRRVAVMAAGIRTHRTEAKLLANARGNISGGAFCGGCAQLDTREPKNRSGRRPQTKRKGNAPLAVELTP